MLKKLLAGELSLVDTFWKFGVLGLVFVTLIVRIFGKMLSQELGHYSILRYIIAPGSDVKFSTTILILMYLSSLSFLLFYSYSLLAGIWRSSAEYNRSLWFRHLARIFMALMVFIALKITFGF